MRLSKKYLSEVRTLIAIGFLSILGQIVLLRELNIALYGIELIYLLGLGIWLFWSSIGAILAKTIPEHTTAQRDILFLIITLLLPIETIFIRAIRPIMKAVPGAFLPFTDQLLIIAITILPICILLGALFIWTTENFIRTRKTLAQAYGLECLGGMIGGLSGTLMLHFGFSNLICGFVCSLVSLALILINLKRISQIIAILMSLIFIFSIINWKNLDKISTQWTHPNLAIVTDTPYYRIAVDTLAGQVVVFENNALAYDNESTSAEAFVQIAALHSPHPQNILILGGALFGLIDEVLKLQPLKVICVEYDRKLTQTVQSIIQSPNTDIWRSPKVQMVIEDPRKFLSKTNTDIPDKFDLILIGMPEPASGQTNRYYTQEFFNLCSKRLKDDGVLAFRLKSAENLWTDQMLKRIGNIYHTLKDVIRNTVILPGTTNLIIASKTALPTELDTLNRRFAHRNIQTRLVTPQLIHYLYTNDRFQQIKDQIAQTKTFINTDAHPLCYHLTTLIWLSQFYPQLFKIDTLAIFNDTNKILLALLILIVLIFVKIIRIEHIFLVGVAGLMGMLLESALLLGYQIRQGILYQDIGILLSAFMLGMTGGAYGVSKIDRIYFRAKYQKLLVLILLFGIVLLSLISYKFFKNNWFNNLIGYCLGMFFSGFFTAAIFAVISNSKSSNNPKIISPLYAADLIGGCLGIIWGSIFIIPILGITNGFIIVAGFALLSLILI